MTHSNQKHHDEGQCCSPQHKKHHHEGCCSQHECSDEESSCHHGKESECCHADFAHELLCLADQAWMELLKEKIKQRILATNGGHLDQLAEAVADSNNARWKHKLGLMRSQREFKDKLENLFSCQSGSCEK